MIAIANAPFTTTVGTVIISRNYNIIHLPEMTSNGRTGKEWVAHREKNKQPTSKWAKDILTIEHKDGKIVFVATNGVIYKPVVLLGSDFSDEERTTENIRKVGSDLKLITPSAELGTLVRESISNEQIQAMGLNWLVTMHEPIIDSDGVPFLLGSFALDSGSLLDAYRGKPTGRWARELGFVFLSPQG